MLKAGQLSEEESAFIRTVFNDVAAGSTEASYSLLPRMLTDINAGIRPTPSDIDSIEAFLQAKAPTIFDVNRFAEGVHFWYLNTKAGKDQQAEEDLKKLRTVAKLRTHINEEGGKDRQLVLQMFTRYDKKDEGVIRLPELQEMMADLNCGAYPTDQEAQHVMWFADSGQKGCLDVDEFETAVTFWYIQTMEERERTKSHCCVIL
eukprot:gene15906-24315_t